MACFCENGIQLQRNSRVCHTVAAKWRVFHEKPKGYVNNPRNCRFPGLGNVESAFWGSEGASEVDAKASEKSKCVLGAQNEAPRGFKVDLATPCEVFRGVFVLSKFFVFRKECKFEAPKVTLTRQGPCFKHFRGFSEESIWAVLGSSKSLKREPVQVCSMSQMYRNPARTKSPQIRYSIFRFFQGT